MNEKVKCLIIGSGPAGYTAAIYAARANMNPVLYQGLQPGGQLMNTTEVENFPGYPDGIMGPQMMMDLEAQARRMGTDIRFGYATKAELTDGGTHKICIDDELWIDADSVIISTGASAKWLGIESETKYNGHGVSACAVCDGFFFKGKDVAIVGAGDSACEEAIYLSHLCPVVHMIVRKNEMKASKIMQERVLANPKIVVHWNTETVQILGDEKVNAVELYNNKTKENFTLEIKGFFVAIGHQPNSDIFKNQIDMDETGYILTVPGSSKTNLKGVFACGDVQDKNYKQAITAAGSGCMAALDAERYLSAKAHESA